jgi:hypothetical protein
LISVPSWSGQETTGGVGAGLEGIGVGGGEEEGGGDADEDEGGDEWLVHGRFLRE